MNESRDKRLSLVIEDGVDRRSYPGVTMRWVIHCMDTTQYDTELFRFITRKQIDSQKNSSLSF